MKCDYCGKEAEWVENKEIYGRNYGKSYMMWLCRGCDAYVGCHNNTRRSKGSLANKELRELRKTAHALFDPLWENMDNNQTRAGAYAWLVKNTGVQHIGESTKEGAQRVISFLKNGGKAATQDK